MRRPPRLPESEYIGCHRIFFTMCTFHRSEQFVQSPFVEPIRGELLHTAVETEQEGEGIAIESLLEQRCADAREWTEVPEEFTIPEWAWCARKSRR